MPWKDDKNILQTFVDLWDHEHLVPALFSRGYAVLPTLPWTVMANKWKGGCPESRAKLTILPAGENLFTLTS